jgi:hypothetical protein
MYWILTEKAITQEQLEQAMEMIFPGKPFLFRDFDPESFEPQMPIPSDEHAIIYSIVKWSKKIRTKIDFYNFPEEDAIKRMQFIGQFISKTYDTKVVTELDEIVDPNIYTFRLLLIDGDVLQVINDLDIELDEYEYKIMEDFKEPIDTFDKDANRC